MVNKIKFGLLASLTLVGSAEADITIINGTGAPASVDLVLFQNNNNKAVDDVSWNSAQNGSSTVLKTSGAGCYVLNVQAIFNNNTYVNQTPVNQNPFSVGDGGTYTLSCYFLLAKTSINCDDTRCNAVNCALQLIPAN